MTGRFNFRDRLGFQPQKLLTPQSLAAWGEWQDSSNHQTFWIDTENHDTIGMVAADGKGKVAPGAPPPVSPSRFPVASRTLPRGLSRLRRRYRGRGLRHRRWRSDDQLLHLDVYRGRNRSRGATARGVLERDAVDGAHSANLHTDMYCVIAINPRGEVGAMSMNTKQMLEYALWRGGTGALHLASTFYS